MTATTVYTTDNTTVIFDGDPGKCAHIVKTEPGQNAAAMVLTARVTGTPIEALCGHTWVPSQDATRLPVCPKCKDIYGMYRAYSETGLNETPVGA